jgi:NAD(P)-dependent dehydrogenase (short-subunit alcohol dehydrogenase family)
LRALSSPRLEAWGGLDTIHIVAGVLSTKTFAALSGSSATVHTRETAADSVNKRARSTFGASDKQGVQNVVDLARKALETNYIGALASYATFLPFLSSSSAHPTIVLLSTVAAVLPTPTRTLYSASKGATHSLLASLALESDILGLGVEFIEVLAGSVNTSLRTRAVDASSSGPTEPESKWSLAPSTVAAKVIKTVDKGLGDGTRNETLRLRQVWLPQKPYRWAHLLYWLPGSLLRGQVENGAREKYSAALGL